MSLFKTRDPAKFFESAKSEWHLYSGYTYNILTITLFPVILL